MFYFKQIKGKDMVNPTTVEHAANYLSSGSISAVIFILIAVIAGLVWERNRLLRKLDRMTKEIFDTKDKELNSLKTTIDLYYQGNLKLSEALTEIKTVLSSIHPNRR